MVISHYINHENTKQQNISFPAGRIMLFCILTLAILVNFLQFADIDGRARHNYRAIHIYDTADIAEIGLNSSSHTRGRYGLWFALAEISPSSRVVISTMGSYMSWELKIRMFGFGRVVEVTETAYDLQKILFHIDPTKYVIASGQDGSRGTPYAIAVKDFSAEEFLLVRWDGPSEPFKESKVKGELDYYDLLLDISLLPNNLREELRR